MSIYTYFFFVCNRLHLIKICLCCFLGMHLYSNSLSTIATIYSLFKLDLFPASLSFGNNFNLSRSSLGSDGKKIVIEIPDQKSLQLAI